MEQLPSPEEWNSMEVMEKWTWLIEAKNRESPGDIHGLEHLRNQLVIE